MKRFYSFVESNEEETGYSILLDGEHLRTPSRKKLIVPTFDYAQALCEEWKVQGEEIDIRSLYLTKLTNSIVDGVAYSMDETRKDIASYIHTDLLCYRVESPEELSSLQRSLWGSIQQQCESNFNIHIFTTNSLIKITQSAACVNEFLSYLNKLQDPFTLGAFHILTTISGSLILAICLKEKKISLDKAWEAAHLDEIYQEKKWGIDEEALERRKVRYKEFSTAYRILKF